MDLGLTNKVVLVTGGSKGIGLAVAQAFAEEGAVVAIVSRDTANIAAAKAQLAELGLQAYGVAANLSDAAQAERAVAQVERELGPIDILINSAGAAKRHEPENLDAAIWHTTLDAKFFPYIHTQDAVLKRFRERAAKQDKPTDIGNIVNIIGVGGKLPTSTHIAGGAANAALMLSTVAFAHHYARIGVRINGINPGFTLTGRVNQSLELESKRRNISKEQVLREGQEKVPLGRYADPREIADVALFLASQRASYVVGAIVPLDGGNQPVI